MSNKLQILILLAQFLTLTVSTYIKTDETVAVLNEDHEIVTFNPALSNNDSQSEEVVSTTLASQEVGTSNESQLTEHVLTGDLFLIHVTIKHDWTDEFTDKNSKAFRTFAEQVENEMISFIDNRKNIENSITRENFMVKNVLKSNMDGYVYVTIVMEATNHVSGQFVYDELDLQLRIYNKIYEMETSIEGFGVESIAYNYLENFDNHVDCDNAFCKLTSSESTISEEVPENVQSAQCHPNRNFHQGSTSIYIFDNNKECIDTVKKRSTMTSPQSCGKQEIRDESVSTGSDELDTSASNTNAQTVNSQGDEEVIVVIRKKGDKVFIEI